MKTEMKVIFPLTLAALVGGAFAATAATGTASTNAAPAAVGTNASQGVGLTFERFEGPAGVVSAWHQTHLS